MLKDDGTDDARARTPSGSNYGDGRGSRCVSCRVDSGMGNYGTTWADIQAIQLLLNTCFLCGWDATSLSVLFGEVLVLRRMLVPL